MPETSVATVQRLPSTEEWERAGRLLGEAQDAVDGLLRDLCGTLSYTGEEPPLPITYGDVGEAVAHLRDLMFEARLIAGDIDKIHLVVTGDLAGIAKDGRDSIPALDENGHPFYTWVDGALAGRVVARAVEAQVHALLRPINGG